MDQREMKTFKKIYKSFMNGTRLTANSIIRLNILLVKSRLGSRMIGK
jgi:hypothetical protein